MDVPRRHIRRFAAPVVLTLLLAATGLSAASVAYEYSYSTHASGSLGPLVLGADSVGVLLAAAFGVQLMLAYRLFAARPAAQFSAHRLFAWAIIALGGVHAPAAFVHVLRSPEPSQVVILVTGTVVAVGVAAQIASGYGQKKRRGWNPWHVTMIVVTASIVIAHVTLGTIHAITG